MYRNDDVCHKVADRSNESYTSLSESKMYSVVEQGRGVVADKRTEEDE
jgi:hypothetical protein